MNYRRFNALDELKALNSKSPFLEILDSVTLLSWLTRLTLRDYILGQIKEGYCKVVNPEEREQDHT